MPYEYSLPQADLTRIGACCTQCLTMVQILVFWYRAPRSKFNTPFWGDLNISEAPKAGLSAVNVARVTPYLLLNFCFNCSHLSDNIPSQTQSCLCCLPLFYAGVLHDLEIKARTMFRSFLSFAIWRASPAKRDVSQKNIPKSRTFISDASEEQSFIHRIHVTD